VVVNEDRKVLILHHHLRPTTGWGLPGGFVDSNEQPADAIVRELKEETGIEIRDVRMLQVRTLGRHIEILFTARADAAGEILSSEIDHLEWYRPEDLPESLPLHDKQLIGLVLKGDI